MEPTAVWKYGNADGPKCLVRYLQVFNDKTATTLESTALLASVHIVLMNFSVIYRCLVMVNGHTVVGLMPATEGSDSKDSCFFVRACHLCTSLPAQIEIYVNETRQFF